MGWRGKSEEVLILSFIMSNYTDNLSGMKRKG